MADFCRACSIEHFGKDFGDFAGLRTPEGIADDRWPLVICEGCGFIQVDDAGNCITPDCSCKGQPGHGVPTEERK